MCVTKRKKLHCHLRRLCICFFQNLRSLIGLGLDAGLGGEGVRVRVSHVNPIIIQDESTVAQRQGKAGQGKAKPMGFVACMTTSPYAQTSLAYTPSRSNTKGLSPKFISTIWKKTCKCNMNSRRVRRRTGPTEKPKGW